MKTNVIVKNFTENSLQCYYYNATSIRGKLDDFNSHFSAYDYDVISVVETWLNDSVFDREILSNCQFKIFRRDHLTEISNISDSSGILLAVNSKLSVKLHNDLSTRTLMEMIWVEIVLTPRKSVFVSAVYIP